MSTVHEEKNAAPQCATTHAQEHCAGTFDGNIVSVTGDKLVMKNHEGKECSHTLAKDAKLTRDGMRCSPADLKVGSRSRITTKKDDRNVVTGIESLEKHTEFAKHVA
jgi:hypothetical protein